MRLLDDLRRRSTRDEHPPEGARDCPHRRARLHELPAQLDRVLSDLDRLGDRLHRLLGKPARSMKFVVRDPVDPLRQLRLHARLLEHGNGSA